jgi:large subunit ribosomal protein L25
MATITVKAELRERRGKGDSKKMRREGKLPVTVYGGDAEPVAASVSLAELAAILRSDRGQNTIFKLDVDGVGVSDVMFQDRQIDPVRSRLIHADLRRIVSGQLVEVTVDVELVGEAYGVKEQGGHLEQVLREIEIECEPMNIPDKIEADVTNLHANEALHVSDLTAPEGITFLTSGDPVVATIGFIAEEVAAPAAEETPAEPEVIGKGKKEEEQ